MSRMAWVICALVCLVLGCIVPPTNQEMALLVLANQERAARGLSQLRWNDSASGAELPGGLAAAARAHSKDMAENDCFQHNSCNGESWSVRVSRYYPGWSALGENITLGGEDPRQMHADWMASPGHRANILGPYSEYGAGVVFAATNFGDWAYATTDFGFRGLVAIGLRPILAAAVLPRLSFTPVPREFLANYFDADPPQAIRALVGPACVPLTLVSGSATNGTYGTTYELAGTECVPVAFEAVQANGDRYRWPEKGALLVGGLDCPERAANAPQQDCGG